MAPNRSFQFCSPFIMDGRRRRNKIIAKTMSFLRDLFGPSRDEIWQQFSAAVGGNMTQGGFWSGGSKVDEPYKGRVFDPCCGSGGIEEKWKMFVEKGAEVYAKA
jgi:hypothetical protein